MKQADRYIVHPVTVRKIFIYIVLVQIDAFINIYFSIMEIAVVTYVRIGRISFFLLLPGAQSLE
jgi:hypothetical protein